MRSISSAFFIAWRSGGGGVTPCALSRSISRLFFSPLNFVIPFVRHKCFRDLTVCFSNEPQNGSALTGSVDEAEASPRSSAALAVLDICSPTRRYTRASVPASSLVVASRRSAIDGGTDDFFTPLFPWFQLVGFHLSHAYLCCFRLYSSPPLGQIHQSPERGQQPEARLRFTLFDG